LRTKYRRRCCSCNNFINIGDVTAAIYRYKVPENDIEERIYGEEVPLATKYLCEECADLNASLQELGYCISPLDNQHELIKEYTNMKELTS